MDAVINIPPPPETVVDQWLYGGHLVRTLHRPSQWLTPYRVTIDRDGKAEDLPERHGDLMSASLYAKRVIDQRAAAKTTQGALP